MAAESVEIAKEWITAVKNCINVENYFKYCEKLQKEPILAVVRVLCDNSCKSLTLEHTPLTLDDAKGLGDMLRRNKTLSKLAITDSGLTDCFMEVISTSLAHNEGLFVCFNPLKKVIKMLDLSSNRISNEGVADLVDGLYVNVNLFMLSLSHNVFSDVGAVHLSDLLKGNVSLTRLDISFNQIGPKGAQALAGALQSNQFLKELELGQYVYL